MFGVYQEIKNMIDSNTTPSKQAWAARILNKAWSLEDQYWNSQIVITNCNYLMRSVCGNTHYSNWWLLSDNRPMMTKTCEMMIRILSQVSLLKADDFNLKCATHLTKSSPNCDLGIVEDIRHIIMQCPNKETEKSQLLETVKSIPDGSGQYMIEHTDDIFAVLMGANYGDIPIECMFNIWEISGIHIVKIFNKVVLRREGIG